MDSSVSTRELWSYIPNYLGYQASTLGNIRNKSTEYVLKPYLTNRGYHTVGFTVNGKKKRLYIHRLVASTFLDNNDNLPEVNHINGIKTDNRITNLEWSTGSTNILHAYSTGLRKSKLTPQDKQQILQLLQQGMTHRTLGKLFNVSHSTIGSLARSS